MADTIISMGHTFKRRDDGLYEAQDTFELENDNNWFLDKDSHGRILVTKIINGKTYPYLISTDAPNHKAYRNFMVEHDNSNYGALIADHTPQHFLGGAFL